MAIVAFRWLALLAAGAVAGPATGVGLLLSVHIGLFGCTESLSVPTRCSPSPSSSPPPSSCWPTQGCSHWLCRSGRHAVSRQRRPVPEALREREMVTFAEWLPDEPLLAA